jgi:hypothetical protein
MAAVDFDRQAIERRDFPISRRGYEPAAVDVHLRALAGEIEQLQRERADGGAEPSLASTAGTQVQSILAAAEATAADIERQAREAAQATREAADRDAAHTREQAIAQARGQVTFVTQATAALLERVNSMDGEVSALVESLRAGADRLIADLAAVDANMGQLYDAATGQAAATPPPSPPERAEPDVHVDPDAPAARERISSGAPPSGSASTDSGDLDSARLVALNMALNGESREDADRYLAEHYQLADRGKLIDEVYAAIEG